MAINMDEAKLRTIAQLQEFLDATQECVTGVPWLVWVVADLSSALFDDPASS
jgi:hypothetical protein